MSNQYLKKLVLGVKETYFRFPIACTLAALSAIYQVLVFNTTIFFYFIDKVPFIGLFPMFLPYACVLSIVISIALERYNWNPKYKGLTQLLSILLGWSIVYFSLKGVSSLEMLTYTRCAQLVSLFIVLILLPNVLPFLHKNSDRSYVNFYLRSIGYQIKSGLLFCFIGICIFVLVAGVNAMFFGFNNYEWMLYVCIALSFGQTVYFMHQYTPAEDIYDNTTVRNFKVAKTISYYVLLPIIGLHLLFIYLYGIKLIISSAYPNTFFFAYGTVVFATCLFTMHLLYNETKQNKLAKCYARWMWLILLPLHVLMVLCVVKMRNNDVNDILVNILIWYLVWQIGISVFLFITKSSKLKWVFLSYIAVSLIYAFMPFGIRLIETKQCQQAVKEFIEKNDLLLGNGAFYMGELCNKLNEIYEMPERDDSEVISFMDNYNKAVYMGATSYLEEKCVNFDSSYRIILSHPSTNIQVDSCYINKDQYNFRFDYPKADPRFKEYNPIVTIYDDISQD